MPGEKRGRMPRAFLSECPRAPAFVTVTLMSKTTGHIIRMIGMLIEMLGVWGVYQASNSKTPWVISIPGAGTMPVAWLAVFVGLIIWLAGVFIVYSNKPFRHKKMRFRRRGSLRPVATRCEVSG